MVENVLSSNICMLAASTTIGIILKFPFEDLEKKELGNAGWSYILGFFFFFLLCLYFIVDVRHSVMLCTNVLTCVHILYCYSYSNKNKFLAFLWRRVFISWKTPFNCTTFLQIMRIYLSNHLLTQCSLQNPTYLKKRKKRKVHSCLRGFPEKGSRWSSHVVITSLP